MNELRSKKIGITHGGSFHTDDVISTAFLRTMNPDIKITRVLEYDEAPKDEEIVYDIGLGEFDHHQQERRIDDNGHPYCAFGLLWEKYGRIYLEECGFRNIEYAFDMFKKNYVYKMDQGDNEGYKNVNGFIENNMIINCKPLWFEGDSEELMNARFEKAVRMGIILLNTWTRTIYKNTEDHDFYEFGGEYNEGNL